MLSHLTAGLVPDRDPAQPLLTYVAGPDRIELSGATTANWVCKTANLLVDGYDSPARVGILLPLHWQLPCLLLGAVAAGATAVVSSDPAGLTGCAFAFTTAETAEAALDAGVEEVFACSLTPFASRLAELPAGVSDAAVEIPGYGDRFGGRPTQARVEVDGELLVVPVLGVGPKDRVLTSQDPCTAEGLGTLLGALRAGSALVLLREGDAEAVARQEGVTRSFS
ncbi:MAG: AMP-dependent synthetase and ligase [Frankiales bacterium]|nr:AMP-dependent synthetase and ligase [Frankiales bacterium]